MTNEIIPQLLRPVTLATLPAGHVLCPKCEGRRHQDDPQRVYVDPPLCMACRGTGTLKWEGAPVVNICSSSFVAACNLRVMGGDVTALDALETVSTLLEKVKPQTCSMCQGEGSLVDPFEDAEVRETCRYCNGAGKRTSVFLEGDVTMLFAQIKDLAVDLRAALNETKGTSNEPTAGQAD